MSEAVVPSEVFFSNIHPIAGDPWALDHDPEPHYPYKLRKGQATVVVSFRMPDHMYSEMKQIVEQRIIPGIESYADFNVSASAYFLTRFHELGIEGFSGFKTVIDNDIRRQRNVDRKNLLESNEDTIELLRKDGDIFGLRATLQSVVSHRNGCKNEPDQFMEKLNKQIKRLEEILEDSK